MWLPFGVNQGPRPRYFRLVKYFFATNPPTIAHSANQQKLAVQISDSGMYYVYKGDGSISTQKGRELST